MLENRPAANAVRGVLAPLCLSFALCAHALPTNAATALPGAVVAPDLVTEPSVNLGNTSFYDGFGQFTPGFAFVDYGRWQHLTSISSSKGRSVSAFRDPDIEVLFNVFQFVWITPLHVPHGAISVMALVPVVDLSSSFTQPGTNLRSNGFGVGDITWGPIYQSAPYAWGKQVFSYRLEFDVLSPAGKFDRTRDINQSSGFWSINPHVAFSYLPSPGWEISARLHYLYNFSTNQIPDPPVIENFSFRNGQAGQAAWINFAASRELTKGFALGVNGYYFQQLTDDKINNVDLSHTRKNQVYVGPGMHWQISRNNILNFNVYLPVTTHGVANGPQLGFQFVRPIL